MVQCGNRELRGIVRIRIGVKIGAAGERTVPEPSSCGEDVIGVDRRLFTALADGLFDHLHRILGQ